MGRLHSNKRNNSCPLPHQIPKVSGDCKLLEEVLSRLLSVSGKKPQEDILEKVSNLVAAVISSHKEYLSSTLQAKTDEKTQAKAAQVKSKSAVTGTNATTTQAKGLSATKKQYLNIGASKKKFNKYWLKGKGEGHHAEPVILFIRLSIQVNSSNTSWV